MADSSEDPAAASFRLPASPCLSPSGADNMSVWVEDAGGEQRVHVELHSAPPSPPSPPSAAEVVDFPLFLCDSSDGARAAASSSAIVPFQKLQLDTNLNQTLLPYRSAESPTAVGAPASPRTAKQLASSFLAMEHERKASAASIMSAGFMTALRRLGDRREAPELSVRLKGSRIELASASEDEQVDFLGPAENIKQLFKLPYSHSGVSLAVHRVGSTLVVDGELAPDELPAGFDDAPQESISIQQQSLPSAPQESTSEQQTLLYEKFIFESAMRARLSPPSSGDVSSEGIGKEGGVSSNESAAKVSDKVQPKIRQTRKSKKTKKKTSRTATAIAVSHIGTTSDKGSTSGEILEDTASDTSLDMIPSPRLTGGNQPNNLGQQFTATTQEQEEAATARAFAKTLNPGMPRPFPTAGQYTSEESAAAAAAWSSPASYDFPTFQRVLKWKFHDLKMVRTELRSLLGFCFVSD